MTNREELHLLAGAYALGALDETERKDFERYLLTSEEARAEMASLSDTAVMIGLATAPVTPPASLKASLMAQVAVTPQLPVLAESTSEGTPSNVSSIFDARPVRAAGSATKAQRRWYSRPGVYLAAAAAAVAIFLGSNVVGFVNNNTQQAQQASSVTEISAASDSQHASSSVTGGGKATLIWSNKLAKSAVVMAKLPSLPEGKTYELWYIAGPDVRAAGTFQPKSDGSTAIVLTGKMTDGDTIGITVEPSGGSTKPTTKPVVAIPTA
jgi:anti-sigma-K factor RskA